LVTAASLQPVLAWDVQHDSVLAFVPVPEVMSGHFLVSCLARKAQLLSHLLAQQNALSAQTCQAVVSSAHSGVVAGEQQSFVTALFVKEVEMSFSAQGCSASSVAISTHDSSHFTVQQ